MTSFSKQREQCCEEECSSKTITCKEINNCQSEKNTILPLVATSDLVLSEVASLMGSAKINSFNRE